jgi:hypothetical protein
VFVNVTKASCNYFLFRDIIKEWGCFAIQKILMAGITQSHKGHRGKEKGKA